MWHYNVQRVVSWNSDRDDPRYKAIIAWINSWHCSPLIWRSPKDRVSVMKGPIGMPWMDDGRILNYKTGYDFTNELPIMFLERQHREDPYFDLHGMQFVGVGHVSFSLGHFPAAPVHQWKPHRYPHWIWLHGYPRHFRASPGSCVLVSLVSARDGLRILRGMRTLQRIYLYKLARKAISPFAVASSKTCDLASIGTLRNEIYGFLRTIYYPTTSDPKDQPSDEQTDDDRNADSPSGNEHDSICSNVRLAVAR